MPDAILRVFRGDKSGGQPVDYKVPLAPGMVVLDALHSIQAHQSPDLAVRWNCKAAKCGSCSAEVNGFPRLLCKSPIDEYADTITVRPMRAFPVIRDLVTDDREGAHRAHRDRVRVLVDRRLAQQAREAVDLGRAGAALGRLAVPPHGE